MSHEQAFLSIRDHQFRWRCFDMRVTSICLLFATAISQDCFLLDENALASLETYFQVL